jgi:hypothetical protein
MSTLTVCNVTVPLTKCYKTDEYYRINEYKISSKYAITLSHYDDGYYEIWMIDFDNLICGGESGCYNMKYLTFETVWKILKPTPDSYTNFVIIRNESKCAIKCHMTESDIRTNSECDCKIIDLLYAKLHKTETDFRQKLLHCSRQTDCKIDFF